MSVSKKTHHWLTTRRIETLTDGVYSIAMTLLVLNLRFPTIPESSEARMLPGVLVGLWPHFFSYAVSFLLLAVFWTSHHKQFDSIKQADETLLWINIVGLMFVVLIPFSTNLIGEYERLQISAVFFECNLFLVGLMSYVNWRYATGNHRLTDSAISSHAITMGNKKNLVIPAMSLIAIGLSFASPLWSMAPYALIPLVLIKYSRKSPI
jgi:uncharacterized membrane protein